MQELHRNAYMTAVFDEEQALITLEWTREEPDDAHAVETARAVNAALDAHVAKNATKFAMLVDLTVVSKTFPRATAAYTGWILAHRANLRGGAFATKSFIMRAGLTTAVLVPGVSIKGFSDVADARKFVRALPR